MDARRTSDGAGAPGDALAASEERYRLVNEATHDVIWDWDLETGNLVWNDAIEATFGYRREDVPPDLAWWSDHLHPDDRERVVRGLEAAIDDPGRRAWSDEYRFLASDGRWCTVLDRGFVVRDPGGRGVRMIGSILDITERKRVEDAVRESEAQLRYLADAMPQLVWTTRPDGHHEWFNRRWYEYTGTAETETHGEGWSRLLHPDDLERTLTRWGHSLRTGEPYEIEYRFRRASDGAYRWFLGRALPIRDADGRIVRWFGTCTDIHEQKRSEEDLRRAEQALRESEARAQDRYAELEQIYRYAPVGLFTFDREYRFQRINERMAEINGFPADAHIGRSMYEIVPDLAEYLREVYRPVLERGEPVLEVDVHGATPKAPDVPRDWLCSYFPLRSGTGEVIGLIGAVLEVTERKAAERALLRSQEALREADRRKDEFLAVLSHELRNPLGPIRNSVYLLERAGADAAQARHAREVIDRQARHMTRLVEDLLDLTRVSRGKVTLRRELVDLNDVVRRAGDDHRDVFAARGVALEVRTADRALHVDGDPTRLAQVVGNLLTNAAKFTPRGGRAWLELAESGPGHALIRVVDDGAGIAPEVLDRVFEPFVQADRTLARSRGGLGLGLALARGLVELHGGSITARSAGAGHGTEFAVTLPTVAPRSAPAAGAASRTAPASRRRVLLVEDNEDMAETLREVLELAGHEVEVAFAGPAALEKARAMAPDVLLCDIGLPGMDGYEVIRAVRADPALRSTYAVALSGYALPDDVQKAEDAGFDRHVAKPVEHETLQAVLSGERGA